MPTLKRRQEGPLESEFIIRAGEFAVAVDYRSGHLARGRALEYLLARRWSRIDADAFLDMALGARK